MTDPPNDAKRAVAVTTILGLVIGGIGLIFAYQQVELGREQVRLASQPHASNLETTTVTKSDSLRDVTPQSDKGFVHLSKTLLGHFGSVNAVAISPKGQLLASGSDDHTVKLWDLSTGQDVKTLVGHQGRVCSVAFSADGRMLASGSADDDTIKLWDVADGQILKTFQSSDSVLSIAFSRDARFLVTVSNTFIELWDLKTGRRIRASEASDGLALSPDSSTIVFENEENLINLADFATGRVLRSHKMTYLPPYHTLATRSFSFSPDGTMIASSSNDATIILWYASNLGYIRTLKGHTEAVNVVAFSPTGYILASGSYDHRVKLWDAESGEVITTLEGHTDSVESIAFSPDGQLLASGSSDKTIKLWALSHR